MVLSGKFVKRIVEALMSAFPNRDDLVMMLRFEFSIPESGVSNASDYKKVVFSLVGEFERENRIIKLIENAYNSNSGNSDLARLYESTIPIIRLGEILSPMEKELIQQMKQAYRFCCPDGWHDGEKLLPLNLKEILDNLEEMAPDSNAYSRTEKFVARLLVDAKNKLFPKDLEELKNWGEKNSKDFYQLLTQIDQERERKETRQNNIQSHLIILLESSKQYPNRYFISAWFIPDGRIHELNYPTGEKYIPITVENEDTCFLEEIPGILKSIFEKILEQPTFSRRQTMIEFFLPHDLLNKPIDAWTIPDEDDVPTCVGSEYKVIVRSCERLKKYRYKNDWKYKWESFQKLACSEGFVSGDGYSWEELYSRLNQGSGVALKLMKSPSQKIFKVLNKTAIPAALWVREELQNLNLHAELDNLLKCSIKELTERVKDKRLEAFPKDKQNHIGHHLALLWENPYILPPDINYTTPS